VANRKILRFLKTVLVAWIAGVILTNVVHLFPKDTSNALHNFDASLLSDLSNWTPWKIVGIFVEGFSHPDKSEPAPAPSVIGGKIYRYAEPNTYGPFEFLKKLPSPFSNLWSGFSKIFREILSGGWVAWITAGIPAALSLVFVVWGLFAEDGKDAVRLLIPGWAIFISGIFLLIAVLIGTAIWVVALCFTLVVEGIAYMFPGHPDVTPAPALAAVFALVVATITRIVEELVEAGWEGIGGKLKH
jgi:uncharacterized protein YjeT (DUF2065 family)